jgi:trk system potassium uptake protein TrkA
MRILIFGAGRVGKALLRILKGTKNKITVVDSEKSVCDETASEFDVHVVCADVSDPEKLEELKLHESDFVFAVTGNEETNFLVSVYARHANAKRVISRASEAKYSLMMEKLGVEPLIPEMTLARELANMVLSPLVSKMLDPSFSNVEMFEKDVDSGMKGRSVGELSKKFSIVSIYHDGKFRQPQPETVLEEGMRVIIVKHNG